MPVEGVHFGGDYIFLSSLNGYTPNPVHMNSGAKLIGCEEGTGVLAHFYPECRDKLQGVIALVDNCRRYLEMMCSIKRNHPFHSTLTLMIAIFTSLLLGTLFVFESFLFQLRLSFFAFRFFQDLLGSLFDLLFHHGRSLQGQSAK